jgi:type VI secretion system secreted protein Hcp
MAFDAFLKLNGIKGESADDKHRDEIEIESFSWGLSNAGTTLGGGGGAGRASFQDFSFTAGSSKASPLLFEYCATGKHIQDATLTLRGAGEAGQAQEFYVVKLEDVLVTVYTQGGAAEGDHPMDEFALRYQEIDVNYDGIARHYDLRSQKA